MGGFLVQLIRVLRVRREIIDINKYRLLGLAFVVVYALVYLIRLSLDKNSTFEEPIKQELEAHNFGYENSINPSKSYLEQITRIQNDSVHANPMGAGLAVAASPCNFVFKEVAFRDGCGELQNALIAIDFRGHFFRRIVSLRWYPLLSSFKPENT